VEARELSEHETFSRRLFRKHWLFVLSHVSNVTGPSSPRAAAKDTRERRILYLVEAAQSVGIFGRCARARPRIRWRTGDKGLSRPIGTGMLYIASGGEAELASIAATGGNGTKAMKIGRPTRSRASYEAGESKWAGILGLGEGDILERRHLKQHSSKNKPCRSPAEGCWQIRVVLHYLAPATDRRQVGVVAARKGYDPREVGP